MLPTLLTLPLKRIALALVLLLPLSGLAATVGGKILPDGSTIQCDLPGEFHKKNIASKGLGCCVFRSIEYAALHQQIPALYGFPEWMVQNGIPGGGWDTKVDKLIPQICKDRGYPVPDYIQVTGPWSKVKPIIELATKTNRYVCITYGRSPTKRYSGKSIAHMVCMPHAGPAGTYSFIDNNYTTPPNQAYEHCNEQEAAWAAASGGNIWIIVFLDYGPVPTPHFTNPLDQDVYRWS